MSHDKLVGLGLLIAVASILNWIGVFTQCWLYDNDYYQQECAGIVPFYTTEVNWLAASSWLMFITVALSFIIISLYFVTL
ncbi:hypothetical protein GCK72_020719 [Caenorhabditis remanei]|uniref:G-protein coupled receptors family 1 profile domain-containing protein n=1 Tax=Caenorhabditis remanei TaxID=31234 RepID=A0A6A5GIA1_CAERE|nr:hypothetical protein GCK72_020719 [Caenorhabditis remanei]KAF1754159.1 hypothetical protein GCK72_020719 [Caenorhabditis remanei]